MSMSPQAIVEEAIVRACQSELDRLMAGLGPEEKARRIDSALTDLDKLRSSDRMPDYRRREVALFYALWYLPSQINLAHSLLVKRFDFSRGGNIIDFGAGPGAVTLALAIAHADVREPKPVYVHEIDVDPMRQLAEIIWSKISQIKIEGSLAAARMQDHIRRFDYPDIAALQQSSRWRPIMMAPTPRAVTGLHVVYGDKWAVVKEDAEELWRTVKPDWCAFTTADFSGKGDRLGELSFFPESEGRRPSLNEWGKADRIANLRRSIRYQCPRE